MTVYANCTVSIFSYTPHSVGGTVAAVVNCALQLEHTWSSGGVEDDGIGGREDASDKLSHFGSPTARGGE
jgi:hypothetical protein